MNDFHQFLVDDPQLSLHEFLCRFESAFENVLNNIRDQETNILLDALAAGLRDSHTYVIERSLALIGRHGNAASGIEESVLLCLSNHNLPLSLSMQGLAFLKTQGLSKECLFSSLATMYKALLYTSTSTIGKDPKSLPNASDWKRLAILEVLQETRAPSEDTSDEQRQFFISCLSDSSAVRNRVAKKSWKALKNLGEDPRTLTLELMNCFLLNPLILPSYCSEVVNGSLLSKQRFLLSIFQNVAPLFTFHNQLKQVIDKMITLTPLLDVNEFIWIYQHFSEKQLENEISYLMFRAFYDEKSPSIKALFLKLISYFWKQLPGLFLHEMMNFLLFYTNDVSNKRTQDDAITTPATTAIMHVIPPCSLQVAFRTFNNQMEYYKYNIPDLPKSIINSFLLSQGKQYPYNMLVANIQYELYQQCTYQYLPANQQWLRKVTPIRILLSYFAIKRFDKQAMLYPLLASLPADHSETLEIIEYFMQLLPPSSSLWYDTSFSLRMGMKSHTQNTTNQDTYQINPIFTYLLHLPLNEMKITQCHDYLFQAFMLTRNVPTKNVILSELYRLYNTPLLSKTVDHSHQEMKSQVLAKLRPPFLSCLLSQKNDFMGGESVSMYLQFILQYVEEVDQTSLISFVSMILSNRLYITRYQSFLQRLLVLFDFETRWSILQQLITSSPDTANYHSITMELLGLLFYDSTWAEKKASSLESYSSKSTKSQKEFQEMINRCQITQQILERLSMDLWIVICSHLIQSSLESNHYIEYLSYLWFEDRHNSNMVLPETLNIISRSIPTQFNSFNRNYDYPLLDHIGNFREIVHKLRGKVECFVFGFSENATKESLEFFQVLLPNFQYFTPHNSLSLEDLEEKKVQVESQLRSMELTLTKILSVASCQALEKLIRADFYDYPEYQLPSIANLLHLMEKYQIWIPFDISKNILFAISYRNIRFKQPKKRSLIDCRVHLFLSFQMIFRMETIPLQVIEDIEMILKQLRDVAVEKGEKRIPYEEVQCYCLLATRYPKYFPFIPMSIYLKPRAAILDPYVPFIFFAFFSRQLFRELQVPLPSGKMIAHEITDFTMYQTEIDQALLDFYREKLHLEGFTTNVTFSKACPSFPHFIVWEDTETTEKKDYQKITISLEFQMKRKTLTREDFPLLLPLLQILVETEKNPLLKKHPYHHRRRPSIKSNLTLSTHNSALISPHLIFAFATKVTSFLYASPDLLDQISEIFKESLQQSFDKELWALDEFQCEIIFPTYQLYLQLLQFASLESKEKQIMWQLFSIVDTIILKEQLVSLPRITPEKIQMLPSSSSPTTTLSSLSSSDIDQIRILQLLLHFLYTQCSPLQWDAIPTPDFIVKQIFYEYFFKQRVLLTLTSQLHYDNTITSTSPTNTAVACVISVAEEVKSLIEKNIGSSMGQYLEIICDYSLTIQKKFTAATPENDVDDEGLFLRNQSYNKKKNKQKKGKGKKSKEEDDEEDEESSEISKNYQTLLAEIKGNSGTILMTEEERLSLLRRFQKYSHQLLSKIIYEHLSPLPFITTSKLLDKESFQLMNILIHELLVFCLCTTSPSFPWTEELRGQYIEMIFRQLLLLPNSKDSAGRKEAVLGGVVAKEGEGRRQELYFSDAVLIKLMEFIVSDRNVRNPAVANPEAVEDGPSSIVIIQKDYIDPLPVTLCFRDRLYEEMFDYIAPMMIQRLSEKTPGSSGSIDLPGISSTYYDYLMRLCQANSKTKM